MPVGVEDHVQPPTQPLELGQDRVRVGGVDAAGLPAPFVPDQEAVVVVQAGELVDLERHGRHLWGQIALYERLR